jgi:glycosyltransferase involved in cell wall biosynthesis
VLSGIVPGWRLLRRERPDLVYVSTLVLPLWLLLARLQRISTVCHVHEAERHLPRRLRTLLASPLLLSQRVVANSRFTRHVLLESLTRLENRIVVVTNGVAAPARQTPLRPVLEPPVHLLCVGRLSPRKGTDVAVRAAATLVGEGIDVHLQLVGDTFTGYEWYERQLHELVRELRLADRVTFHGFQPDVWQHLAVADVVVVPSRLDESFGNTAVEALLAQRPVVVSDLPGLREATRQQVAVRLFRVEDHEHLAEQVRGLIDTWPDLVRDLREPAPLRLARFTPDRYRADLVGVLESVLSSERPRPGRERVT